MTTALIYHPIYLQHDTGPHHPERASRLQSILRKLQKTKLIDKLKLIEPESATLEHITLVHSEDYIHSIETLSPKRRGQGEGVIFLDPDTPISKHSYKAALYAAGAVIKAVDLVMAREIDNAFCMVRPPGHHARPRQAMGFCIFNNVAIGARYLQKKYSLNRIAIIDWDVHHGNGTEEIFHDDENVLYISLHQYPHYPGTGSESFPGTINIPMNAGSGDREYIEAFNTKILPSLNEFKPEFIFISAGFDGHRDDPLSSINLTEYAYAEMTKMLKGKIPIVSVLEGGYNLISLSNSVHSHIDTLLA